MECINCGSDENVLVIHTENYPCSCGEGTTIEHIGCGVCSTMWRLVNGDLIEDSIVDVSDFLENASTAFMDAMKDINEYLDENEDVVRFSDAETTAYSSMEECLDRCVKCNALSYEISPGAYQCSSCGAEWEVLVSE